MGMTLGMNYYILLQYNVSLPVVMSPVCLNQERLSVAVPSTWDLGGKGPTSVSWLPDWEQERQWWLRYGLCSLGNSVICSWEID